jgi:MFS family permease
LTLLALAAFLVFGVALVLPGASQPVLAEALGLDVGVTSLFASALSAGLALGVVAGGPLADRWPRRQVFAAAASASAVALWLAALASGATAVFAAFVALGVGAGIYETVLNTAIPERDPERGASRLALVHAAATAGAVIGAPSIGALQAGLGWPAACRVLAGVFAVLALLALPVRFGRPRDTAPATAAPSGGLWPIAPLAAICFAYVGLETALTVLLVPTMQELGHGEARGIASISAFWLGLLAGRLVFAWRRRRARPQDLRGAGLLGAIVLGAAMGLGAPAAELWWALFGVALGPVFPVVVALAGERVPQARGVATGLVVGAGSLGGIAVPALAGGIAVRSSGVTAVASLTLLCGVWAVIAARQGGATAR